MQDAVLTASYTQDICFSRSTFWKSLSHTPFSALFIRLYTLTVFFGETLAYKRKTRHCGALANSGRLNER